MTLHVCVTSNDGLGPGTKENITRCIVHRSAQGDKSRGSNDRNPASLSAGRTGSHPRPQSVGSCLTGSASVRYLWLCVGVAIYDRDSRAGIVSGHQPCCVATEEVAPRRQAHLHPLPHQDGSIETIWRRTGSGASAALWETRRGKCFLTLVADVIACYRKYPITSRQILPPYNGI